MKQTPFEQKYHAQWEQFEHMLGADAADPLLPQAYRQICHHLAIAQSRNYSASLCTRLNDLVSRGHQVLYASKVPWHISFWQFFLAGLPHTLYRNRGYFWFAMALFFVPLFITALACFLNDELILSIMDTGTVQEYEAMYDPMGEHQETARGADQDWLMFGFYIKNNIGIAFQTFASGIFAGLGSVFFLVFNGLMIGATAGHLTQAGFSGTFYPFIAGHGSFELTAIALSGAAGLRMGHALINPGAYTRIQAIKLAGKDAVILIYAVIIMLLIAAFIEAFWSSTRAIPASIKYIVGVFFWALVAVYFIRCSRLRENNDEH